jgi:hypothetical protein
LRDGEKKKPRIENGRIPDDLGLAAHLPGKPFGEV